MTNFSNLTIRATVCASAVLALTACTAVPEAQGPLRRETLQVLTAGMELISVNAGQPGKVLQRRPVTGLPAGEVLVGMDYRISKGVLFAVGRSGRVYTLEAQSGALRAVGNAPAAPLAGDAFGVDVNPVADRIRVVSSSGQNLRFHPDTGALAATDPAPAYAPGGAQSGKVPQLVAAAYTYNKQDDKLTTNYAIDRVAGTLVTQGSKEGVQPVVSPNTGTLFTVGPLGTGPLQDASFDIADVTGAAFAAIRSSSQAPTRLYTIDLGSGRASLIGTVADGAPVVGIAVEP